MMICQALIYYKKAYYFTISWCIHTKLVQIKIVEDKIKQLSLSKTDE